MRVDLRERWAEILLTVASGSGYVLAWLKRSRRSWYMKLRRGGNVVFIRVSDHPSDRFGGQYGRGGARCYGVILKWPHTLLKTLAFLQA